MLVSSGALVVFLGVLLFAGATVEAQQLDPGLTAPSQPVGGGGGSTTGPAGGGNGPTGHPGGGGSGSAGQGSPVIGPAGPALDPAPGSVDPGAEPAAGVVEPRDRAVTVGGPVPTSVGDVARELVSISDRAGVPTSGVRLAPTAVEGFNASSHPLARQSRYPPGGAELTYYGLLDRALRSFAGGYPAIADPGGGGANTLGRVPQSPFAGTLPVGTGSSVASGSGGGVLLLGILVFSLVLWRRGKRFWPPTGFLEPRSALHLVPVRPG
jgi:hypothetical protein